MNPRGDWLMVNGEYDQDLELWSPSSENASCLDLVIEDESEWKWYQDEYGN